MNQIKERWRHRVRITTAVGCVCITKAWKSNFESLDQRYSWLWSKPSFFGGRTERWKRGISVLPPGVLHSHWCTALMQLADFCPAWFVEVTGEFLQASWQLWPSQSGGAEPPEQRWWWWEAVTLWPSTPVDRNNRNPDVTVLLCKAGTSHVLVFPSVSPQI